ncbi:PD-(D/E)XK nuclease family protein [Pseudonocardia endophytica]|uniref:PD-(D/E)XK nuclease superfamily protein n=1 Tax=Pseudonocardia endophytica TaxID=401976 RepID=A0A4R1HYX3_PSEEN|nr:PD-(D/E)XK nuclease family protein [Pseudonocardia endophytica]TCK22782.1 PD-(D/E)XK nuclease superfamily protein [Pseudonocardia endophytica]
MARTLRSAPFGSPAYRALVQVVRQVKGDDPLRPVTVVVPSERVGVAARRALARGDGTPGIAALRITTLRRLAESLAATELVAQGRRPLTGTRLAAAVRDLLTEEPGVFGPVAEHVGTLRAIVDAHRDLRELPPGATDRIPDDEAVARDTARVHRALLERVRLDGYDEVDLLDAAAATAHRVEDDVVAFLPRDSTAPERALLDVIAAHGELHVIDGAEDPTVVADRVVHASDPDEEVRSAVRDVVDVLRDGTAGHRIALLHTAADPYARLLHDHLSRAGVTYSGRGVRTTVETRFGRGLLRMLQLPEHGYRRDEVIGWLTDAPVRDHGERVPASRWDRISRTAGVIRWASPGGWERLTAFAAERRTRAETAEPAPADRLRREADDADALLAFVTDLRDRLERCAHATTWADLGDELTGLWASAVAGEDFDRLAPDEARAVERIGAAVEGIGALGDGTPDAVMARELLEMQLSEDTDRVGTIGTGVHVGPLSEGYGEDVDHVIVLGMAEGLLPGRHVDDPLLPDRVREPLGLPTIAERTRRRHRDLLAALSAAPRGGRTLSFPRGDLRGGGVRVPSRWLLPTLRALTGDDSVSSTSWDRTAAGVEERPSYAGSVLGRAEPATPQEWRQKAVAAGSPPSDEIRERAAQVRAERSVRTFGPFDGDLSAERLPVPGEVSSISATSLEGWARCPFAYFVSRMLRAAAPVQPEDVVTLSPLVRGDIVHRTLHQLVATAGKEGWLPEPGRPWPDDTREVLDELAREQFTAVERAGLTGAALLWRDDQEAILEDLTAWIGHDDALRGGGDLRPVVTEWEFAGVDLPLPDGRTVRLRGAVDRIDRDPSGRIVVTDYKTGRRPRSDDTDPWNGGRRLQLPLYALVAAEEFEHPAGEPVRAGYWYVTGRERFERTDLEIDDELRASALTTVGAIVDGIAGGLFPPRPSGAQHYLGRVRIDCPACEPDGLGERVDGDDWMRLADDDRLAELPAVRTLLFGEES